MESPITLSYRPDGTKIITDDLQELYRLSGRVDPIFGWFVSIDPLTGRFVRRMSHRVIGAELCAGELVLELEPLPTEAGRDLRRHFDEFKGLRLNPYLKGSTNEAGHWCWSTAELIGWDVHVLPEHDSPLDRFMRAVDRPKPHQL